MGDNVISWYKGNQSSKIERTSDLQYYTKWTVHLEGPSSIKLTHPAASSLTYGCPAYACSRLKCYKKQFLLSYLERIWLWTSSCRHDNVVVCGLSRGMLRFYLCNFICISVDLFLLLALFKICFHSKPFLLNFAFRAWTAWQQQMMETKANRHPTLFSCCVQCKGVC